MIYAFRLLMMKKDHKYIIQHTQIILNLHSGLMLIHFSIKTLTIFGLNYHICPSVHVDHRLHSHNIEQVIVLSMF